MFVTKAIRPTAPTRALITAAAAAAALAGAALPAAAAAGPGAVHPAVVEQPCTAATATWVHVYPSGGGAPTCYSQPGTVVFAQALAITEICSGSYAGSAQLLYTDGASVSTLDLPLQPDVNYDFLGTPVLESLTVTGASTADATCPAPVTEIVNGI